MDIKPHLRQPSRRGRGLIPVEDSSRIPVGDDGLIPVENEFPALGGPHVGVPTYDHGPIPVGGWPANYGITSDLPPVSPLRSASYGYIPTQGHGTTIGSLPSYADQRARLVELSKRTGISAIPLGATLEAPSVRPRFQAAGDRDAARQLLIARRLSDPGYKGRSGSLKGIFRSAKSKTQAADPESWVFSFNELSSALEFVIPNRDAVGIAEVLVEMMNATPARNPSRILSRSSPRDNGPSSRFLREATTNCHVNMVCLLAYRAGQSVLNDSLRIAIDNASPEIIKILLEYNADPGAYPQGFQNAVKDGNMHEIVELILRAPKPIGTEHITASLPLAVETKSPRLVSLLIAHGAEVGDKALRIAIGTRDIDLTTRVLLGGPPEGVLGGATWHTLNSPTIAEKQELIERLLFAGACGEMVAKSLIKAVQEGYLDIVRLLVANGASVEYNDAEALGWAVSNGQPDTVEALLQGKLDERYSSMVFSKIPGSAPGETIYRLMSMLISKGARGVALNRALVGSVKRKHGRAAALLVNNNASIDYDDAQALRDAVLFGDVVLVEILLKGHPSGPSREIAFPFVRRASKDVRRQMTKLFLQAGISDEGVSVALKEAIRDTSASRDIDLIKMLLNSSANVSYHSGECLQIAVEQADIPVLNLFLNAGPNVEALSSTIPFAMRLGAAEMRFEVVRLLLSAGATGDQVTQGLINAAKIDPRNMEMITLFLEAKADINFNGGKSLQYATEFGTDQTLERFMALGSPNPTSVSNALQIALGKGIFDKRKVELLLKSGATQGVIDSALPKEIGRPDSYRAEAVDLLLRFNADVNYMNGVAMRIAAERGYNEVLKLCISHGASRATLAAAFLSALTLRDQEEKVTVTQILLEAGVTGYEVDEALVEAAKAYPASSKLVDLLLRFGASVDYDCGRCLQVAAASGDFRLTEILLRMNPSRQSMSIAFPYVLSSTLDETPMVHMVSLFAESTPEKPDLNFDHPQFDPVLFTALKRFPRRIRLLQALLDTGCCVDQKIQYAVDGTSSGEYITVLLWTLCQPAELIHTPIISALLAAGANPDFQATASRKTPLLLAIEKSRGDVVNELIKYRARVRTLDRHGRTALWRAYRASVYVRAERAG